MLTTTRNYNWVENFTTNLLRRVKRSQFAESILYEAEYYHNEQGYVFDVAMVKACENYGLSYSDVSTRPALSRKAETEVSYLCHLLAKRAA